MVKQHIFILSLMNAVCWEFWRCCTGLRDRTSTASHGGLCEESDLFVRLYLGIDDSDTEIESNMMTHAYFASNLLRTLIDFISATSSINEKIVKNLKI